MQRHKKQALVSQPGLPSFTILITKNHFLHVIPNNKSFTFLLLISYCSQTISITKNLTTIESWMKSEIFSYAICWSYWSAYLLLWILSNILFPIEESVQYASLCCSICFFVLQAPPVFFWRCKVTTKKALTHCFSSVFAEKAAYYWHKSRVLCAGTQQLAVILINYSWVDGSGLSCAATRESGQWIGRYDWIRLIRALWCW